MRALLFLTLLLFTAAVGSAGEKRPDSPFLGSTAQFKKSKAHENLLVFRNPQKKASDYKKVLFDPVLIHQSPNSTQKKLTDDEIVELGANFKNQIEEKFKDAVEIVS